MTEKTLFHYTDGFTGAVGDGSAAYTQREFQDFNHAVLAGNLADGGVLSGVGSELQTTILVGPPDTIRVFNGRAQIRGIHYYSDATEDIALPFVPSVGDTGGVVVIRDNDTALNSPPNEDEGRLRVILNTDGTAAIPSITQTVGVTYDLKLAEFVVDTSGNIWTDSSKTNAGVTDTRSFLIHSGSGMIKLREFDGDGVTGVINWSGIQQNLSHLMIVGKGRYTNAVSSATVQVALNGGTVVDSYLVTKTLAGVYSSVNSIIYFQVGSFSGSLATANIHDHFIAYLPNYADATSRQSYSSEGVLHNGGGANMRMNSGIGYTSGNLAVSSITLTGGPLVTGSKITLYGLK